MSKTELSQPAQSIIMRLSLEGLLYLRSFISTPIIAGYGIVAALALTTLLSIITGDTEIAPAMFQQFFPNTFTLDFGVLFRYWWITSLVFHLIQKIIQLTTGVDLSIGYFKKIKLYYVSISIMMLFVILSALLGLGLFRTGSGTGNATAFLFASIAGFITISATWFMTSFVDLFIWVFREGLRQYENPNAPVPHYKWPFKRGSFLTNYLVKRLGLPEDKIFDESWQEQ